MICEKNNLIIGSSSQLSYYFPKQYTRLSSYESFENASKQNWNCVYICFGENRTYNSQSTDTNIVKLFYDINYTKTIETVKLFLNTAKKIVVFSTSELWNEYNGPISLNMPFRFKANHYTVSKYNMTTILNDKKNYPNVSVVYPFNFNGIHRNGNFLFGKVFNSILLNKKIELNDTYYYRDILHPSIIADECINRDIGEDYIIGSGRLIFVNDLIRDLYDSFNMSYEDMVQEKITEPGFYKTKIFYSASKPLSKIKENVLQILIQELKDKQNENRSL